MSKAGIPNALKRRVFEQAQHRCGYCLTDEGLKGEPMQVEHIFPEAQGGETVEENLWLACGPCNRFKGSQTAAVDPKTNKRVALFNPRSQRWLDHFEWSSDGTHVIGKTPCGRATVVALRLNNALIVATRADWISVGWWPPET